MLPQYKGAVIVYNNIIKPVFLKHESTIDAALNAIDNKSDINIDNKTKIVEATSVVLEATAVTTDNNK